MLKRELQDALAVVDPEWHVGYMADAPQRLAQDGWSCGHWVVLACSGFLQHYDANEKYCTLAHTISKRIRAHTHSPDGPPLGPGGTQRLTSYTRGLLRHHNEIYYPGLPYSDPETD